MVVEAQSIIDLAQERMLAAPVQPMDGFEANFERDEIVRYVRERFEAIRTECEAWHEDVNRMRAMYLLWNHRTNIYDVTISRPHNIITFAKGVLFTADYQPTAVPVVETIASVKNQSLYEKFCTALWAANDDRQNTSLKERFLHNQLTDGSAWVQVYIDPEHSPTDQMAGEWGELPVTFEVLDTLEVFPALSNRPDREFEYVITYHQETLEELKDQYPDNDWSVYSIPRNDMWEPVEDSEIMVDVYNYWGYDTLGYIIQTICTDKVLLSDTVLYHSRQYPHLPIIGTPCYTGFPHSEGEEIAGVRLMAKYQSMLRPVDDDVQTAEHIVSADLRTLDLYGNMPPVIKTVGGRPVSIDGEWGQVVELQQGEEIGFPQWPGNPPDSSRLTQFVMGDMQEASFSAAAMGYAGSSASGYHVALTQETSRTRLYLPANAFCRAQKQIAAMAVNLLKTYLPNTAIHLYGPGANGQFGAFAFHPSMADGLHLEVNVKLSMPGDDVRKAAIATQLRALGLPISTILEDVLDYKQPDDIIRKMKQEQAEQHPVIMLLAMAQALQEAGSPFLPLVMQSIKDAMGQMMNAQTGAMQPQGPQATGAPQQQPQLNPMSTQAMPMEGQSGMMDVPGTMPPGMPGANSPQMGM